MAAGVVFALQALLLFTAVRVALLVKYWPAVHMEAQSGFRAMWIGLRMDLAVAFCLAIPVFLANAAVPERVARRRTVRSCLRLAYGLYLYSVTFFSIVDFYFFDEFKARLNYVAVEYLFVTPREVIGNIWQSYPVPLVLVGVGFLVLLLVLPFRPLINSAVSFPSRRWTPAAFLGGWLILSAALLETVDIRLLNADPNRVLDEIAGNGFYTFVYALLTNDLNYDSQYVTMPDDRAFARVVELVKAPDEVLAGNPENPMERRVPSRHGLRQVNVVIVLEESLGSEFVGVLQQRVSGLTPRLDQLSAKGLFFRHFYSTGTRTVRALEAVLASYPPIPGTSVLKRSHSDNVATIAREFKQRGYDTVFIYGGRGSFDGARHFTLANGFDRFIEQKDYSHPVFSTVWGVSDEDIFHKGLEEFDALHETHRPFFATILTVSNHKPYTYPEGRIDLDPEQHKRENAVKYADWALGDFLDRASSHGFFKNTIFAILGDHGARVHGVDFIPIATYEVPLLIYAPSMIAPRSVDTMGSSMDLGPTLLGLLGPGYRSCFFGRDLLRLSPERSYVLLQHDRDVGMFDGHAMAVLGTADYSGLFQYNSTDESFSPAQAPTANQRGLLTDAVAFFQTAYHLYAREAYHLSSSAGLQPGQDSR